MRVVSVAQMRAIEESAFDAGFSEGTLQENAGGAVADEAEQLLRARGGTRVLVLAGRGNNGRDGAVAARVLAVRGWTVRLLLAPGHSVELAEAARLRELGADVVEIQDHAAIPAAAAEADVAVDALLGIGARGALREPLAGFARALNEARRERRGALTVLAIDLPSGIDADTGDVPGEAVEADLTVALGAVKAGLLRFPAAQNVGRLVPRGIGIPAHLEGDGTYQILDTESLQHALPWRPIGAHKYDFGRILVIAGSDRFPGAAALCCSAAARSGAGVVTLAAPASVSQVVAVRRPEVTHVNLDVANGDVEDQLKGLRPFLDATEALVIGPGLGRDEHTVGFVRQLLEMRRSSGWAPRGMVLDADALYALDGWPKWWRRLGPHAIVTPHTGELRRLRAADSQPDDVPWAAAAHDAARWGCVLVAKAPFTVVAEPSGRAEVWPRANPALATGGTGDVLAGVCGGLLAQGASPWDAARLAVAAHATAASAIVDRGWRTLLANDVVEELPLTLAEIAKQ